MGWGPRRRELIDSDTYLAIWRQENSTSIPEKPSDAVFCRYASSVLTFVDDLVYPVWWTDPNRTRFVHHHDSEATPITFLQIVRQPALWVERLQQRDVRFRPKPHVIVECSTVHGVRVVKDGCKGLLACLLNQNNCPLAVTEVSGSDWSGSRLDMGRILAYRRHIRPQIQSL